MLDAIWRFWKTQKQLRGRANEPLGELSEEDQNFLDTCTAQLQLLEVLRQEKYEQFLKRKKMAIPAGAIIALGIIFLLFHDVVMAIILGLVVSSAVVMWVFIPQMMYAKLYKEKILPDILKLFGEFSYLAEGKISMDKMELSKIIPKHDRYRTEDYVSGRYKGCGVEFSEMVLEKERRDKNGNKNYSTIFRGLAILIDMESKKFYGHTILDQDKAKLAEWFKEKTGGLKRANLVDPKFEKIFDVYTNDQVEARYLIDPVMMERLIEVREEYNGSDLSAAYYMNKMLITIKSDQNFFEPAHIEVPATDPRSILTMKKEIGQILSLIDRLDLYDPQKAHEEMNDATT